MTKAERRDSNPLSWIYNPVPLGYARKRLALYPNNSDFLGSAETMNFVQIIICFESEEYAARLTEDAISEMFIANGFHRLNGSLVRAIDGEMVILDFENNTHPSTKDSKHYLDSQVGRFIDWLANLYGNKEDGIFGVEELLLRGDQTYVETTAIDGCKFGHVDLESYIR